MSVATKNSPRINFRPRNLNRSIVEAAIVPTKIVPARETRRTTVVLRKPVTIPPRRNALSKFARLNQLLGGVSGLVFEYSVLVLKLANSTTDRGRITTITAPTSRIYLAALKIVLFTLNPLRHQRKTSAEPTIRSAQL